MSGAETTHPSRIDAFMRVACGKVLGSIAVAAIVAFVSRPASGAVVARATLDRALRSTPTLQRNADLSGKLNGWTYYDVRGSTVGGYVAPAQNDYGFLATGADVLIVPLVSGGSGGVFATLLFTSVATRPRFIGYIPSGAGHLSVFVRRGVLVAQTPVYRGNDPNCCPSALTFTSYTLSGLRLKGIDRYTMSLKP